MVMTIAEQLEQRGLERGLEQGLEQGLKLGQEKSVRETACRMLGRGIDRETVMEVTGLSEIELNQLTH
jgi:predicted transposase/invertase (TIGR01784 family)